LQQVTATPPFAGATGNNSTSGPNGVATGGGCLFAGDGNSNVVSFKVPSYKQVSNLSTGGMFRADELSFDPKDRILFVANNADTPPFGTLINVGAGCKLTIRSAIIYDTAHSGVNATNGAEQPVWDPAKDRFYQSIPSISGTTAAPGPIGAIVRINASTGVVDQQLGVFFCMPAGLALNPTNQTFLAGCSVVYDTLGDPWFGADTNTSNPTQVIIDTNGIFAYVSGIGSSDEVWYNSGDNHWYTGTSNSQYSSHPVASMTGATSTTDEGAAILGVIDGTSQNLNQVVPTINVPAATTPIKHVSGSSHSVAANGSNNWVFVPHPANNVLPGCLAGCIGVYGRNDVDAVGAND
jgi:hypothetical protein